MILHTHSKSVTPSLPSLDTTLCFCHNDYNFYKRKRAGLYKAFTTNTSCTKIRAPLQKLQSKVHLRPKCALKSNIHKGSYRKHCLNSTFSQNEKSKGIHHLEGKLFNKIKNHDYEDQSQFMKYRQQRRLSGYTSQGLKLPDKWGSSTKPATYKLSIFGRNSKRNKSPSQVHEYSRESLQRLVFDDLKLYTQSKSQFINDYSRMVIKQLLVQSNGGAKYREPVSFS